MLWFVSLLLLLCFSNDLEGVYIGGARVREKGDFNGDWEVIEGHEFAKTSHGMHLDVFLIKRESNELN